LFFHHDAANLTGATSHFNAPAWMVKFATNNLVGIGIQPY